MSDFVLFQMLESYRQLLVKKHLFYIEQARKRLLTQFDDIGSEADKAAKGWLEQRSRYFDPEQHDPADFYEAANEEGIEFYGLLREMHEQTRLSIIAGMLHMWDKNLRDWLINEIHHWHSGDNVKAKIWSVDFYQIAEFLQSDIRSKYYFQLLDACHLIVNVYKHGDGKSLDKLKNTYPEYIEDLFEDLGGFNFGKDFRNHNHLKVSDAQFEALSDAVLSFWRDVPEKSLSPRLMQCQIGLKRPSKKTEGT